jgi:hypothetical protein
MADEPVQDDAPKLTHAEQAAKVALDNAVVDLGKAAQGTTLMTTMQSQLLVMQVDVLIDLLAENGAFARTEFWQRITAQVDALATECRRAVLAHGVGGALGIIKGRERN